MDSHSERPRDLDSNANQDGGDNREPQAPWEEWASDYTAAGYPGAENTEHTDSNYSAWGAQGDSRAQYGATYSGPGVQANAHAQAFPTYGTAVANGKGGRKSILRIVLGLVIALILLALAIAGIGGAVYLSTSSTNGQTTQTSQVVEQPEETTKSPLAGRASSAPDWEAVSSAVRPATVAIQVRVGNGGDSGSGVLWDNTGNIVTNYHVVSEASGEDSITVILNDGRLYHAKVVGTDPTTDLAVIKLQSPPADLVAANFGSSQDLKVGQAVMAIGSPLGLDDTVTTGIVSALDRPVAVKTAVPRGQGMSPGFDNPFLRPEQPEPEPVITNAIQVDASINPGNSGGPLFDDAGRVIGINSSIASLGSAEENSGSIGLGFAIPVDLVKTVAGQLIEKGQVDHGQLGVRVATAAVHVDGITRLGLEVSDVTRGSGAEAAGIRAGDYIIAIDGKDVRSTRSLIGYVRRYTSGESVTLKVVRGGSTEEIQVQLSSLNR
ncbi:MAG: trypsin-like peptidase domain-containing protein [Actinomycetaceae bacterium]|nr:trypsin-like peptidase domain-containing protein [Actinomycetaceae bacterium]